MHLGPTICQALVWVLEIKQWMGDTKCVPPRDFASSNTGQSGRHGHKGKGEKLRPKLSPSKSLVP